MDDNMFDNVLRAKITLNKRKEKNTVARRFGGWEGLCFSEEGGWGQIIVENKTVEMVVKDLLLADNQKKKKKNMFGVVFLLFWRAAIPSVSVRDRIRYIVIVRHTLRIGLELENGCRTSGIAVCRPELCVSVKQWCHCVLCDRIGGTSSWSTYSRSSWLPVPVYWRLIVLVKQTSRDSLTCRMRRHSTNISF